MITGESGTGKELIARAIFQANLPRAEAYIAVAVRQYLRTLLRVNSSVTKRLLYWRDQSAHW